MVEILICASFRWLFRRSIVVDGNFHADHLKMRHPKDDVTLADGLAFWCYDVDMGKFSKKSSN